MIMHSSLINRKQYLITNDQSIEIKGWNSISIDSEYKILIHPDTIYSIEKQDNCIVLGRYFDTRNYFLLADINRSMNGNDVTYFWSGRWIKIDNGTIMTDPAGLMGAYYCSKYEQGKFYTAVSSSVSILKKIFLKDNVTADKRSLFWTGTKGTMPWYCPPFSKYLEIKKLLPSQLLIIQNLQTIYITRFKIYYYQYLNYQDKIELLAGFFKYIINTIGSLGNIGIPLTSGNDSRVILAAAISSERCFKTFTFEIPKFTPFSPDKNVPIKIAKKLNIDHHFISSRTDVHPLDFYDAHSGDMTNDGDRYFYHYGHFDEIVHLNIDFIVRSGGLDIARLIYYDLFYEKKSWNDVNAEYIVEKYKVFGDKEFSKKALSDWIQWHASYDNTGIDWREIWYIEQRLCGWLGPIEQSLDLFPFESFQIANCQAIYDIFLSFNTKERSGDPKHGQIQPDIIKTLAPELLRFPINPQFSLFQRIGNKIYNKIWSVREDSN